MIESMEEYIANQKEECRSNAYTDFLSEQSDCYIINRLIGEIGAIKLEHREKSLLIQMILDRNYTGWGDPGFEDMYDNV